MIRNLHMSVVRRVIFRIKNLVYSCYYWLNMKWWTPATGWIDIISRFNLTIMLANFIQLDFTRDKE